MTKLASQLFYLALSKVNPHIRLSKKYDKEFILINISTKEVLNALNKVDSGNSTNHITRLKSAANRMQSLLVDSPMQNRDEFESINVFSFIRFTRKDGLMVEFNYRMTPFLLELSDKPFTQILLQDVCRLRSANSIRLLEIVTIYAHKNAGKKVIETVLTVDEFKKLMYLENNKSEYKIMKRDMLKPCIAEINNLGDYFIEFSEEKDGRKVDKLIFKIKLPSAIYKFGKSGSKETTAEPPTAESIPTEPITVESTAESTAEPAEPEPAIYIPVKSLKAHLPPSSAKWGMFDLFADTDATDATDATNTKAEEDTDTDTIASAEDEALIKRLRSHGYSEKNARSQLKTAPDKFKWAVEQTDNASKAGNVQNYAAYLATMLKQDESFEYETEQKKIRADRKERAERKSAELIAQSDERIKKEQEKLNDLASKSIDELNAAISNFKRQIAGKDPNLRTVKITLDSIKKYEDEITRRIELNK